MNAQWIGIHKNEDFGIRAVKNGENILDAEEKAKDYDYYQRTCSFYFRKTISVTKKIKKAEMKTIGLGFYELFINGEKIGNRVLTPYNSVYTSKILYNTYDITNNLETGDNTVAYHLGGGWFTPDTEYCDWRFFYLGSERLFMELEVEYTDGTKENFKSDEDFLYHEGPIIKSSIYTGEIYDSTKDIKNWNKNDCDISDWCKAEIVEEPGGKLIEDDTPVITQIKYTKPIETYKLDEHTTIYTFAENLTGWEQITVKGKKGSVIEIEPAENINPDHTLNTRTNNMKILDKYTLSGDGIETYCPHFTWHGFKYLAVTVPGDVEIISAEQINVRSHMETTGQFTCNDAVFNELHDKFLRTQLNCMMGNPVDCSQRNERLGWMGDAYVTSLVCLYNFEMKTFYRNYLADIRITQIPDGNISHIAPWLTRENHPVPFDWTFCYPELLKNYTVMTGDTETVKEYYDSLYSFWKFIASVRVDGHFTPPKYGDWMATAEDIKHGDPVCLNTMLFCLFCDIMVENAKITGHIEHISEFEAAHKESRNAILNKHYDSKAKKFIPDNQCTNSVGLFAGLCPEEDKEDVLQHIMNLIKENNGCLHTGIIGTYFMLAVFEKYDKIEEIYKLLMQTGYPSWRNLLENRDTLPEKWNGMGSGCHAMFDMADSYFYSSFAGIRINYLNEIPIEICPWLTNKVTDITACVKDISVKISKCDNIHRVEISIPEKAVYRLLADFDISDVKIDGRNVDEGYAILDAGKHIVEVTER